MLLQRITWIASHWSNPLLYSLISTLIGNTKYLSLGSWLHYIMILKIGQGRHTPSLQFKRLSAHRP